MSIELCLSRAKAQAAKACSLNSAPCNEAQSRALFLPAPNWPAQAFRRLWANPDSSFVASQGPQPSGHLSARPLKDANAHPMDLDLVGLAATIIVASAAKRNAAVSLRAAPFASVMAALSASFIGQRKQPAPIGDKIERDLPLITFEGPIVFFEDAVFASDLGEMVGLYQGPTRPYPYDSR